MTTTHTPSTLLALHDADPEGLVLIACELAGWSNLRKEDQWIAGIAPPNCMGVRWESFAPRYSTSLDAVAELEAGLTDGEHERFQNFLWDLVGPAKGDRPYAVHRRAYISAKPHLRLIAWVLTKQTI